MSEYQRLTGNVGTRELYDYSYSNDSILSNAPEVEKCNNGESYGKPADIYSLYEALCDIIKNKRPR